MVKKVLLYSAMVIMVMSGLSSCKAKHCAALEDGMEGYNSKKVKKRKGRQEGLFDKNVRKR